MTTPTTVSCPTGSYLKKLGGSFDDTYVRQLCGTCSDGTKLACIGSAPGPNELDSWGPYSNIVYRSDADGVHGVDYKGADIGGYANKKCPENTFVNSMTATVSGDKINTIGFDCGYVIPANVPLPGGNPTPYNMNKKVERTGIERDGVAMTRFVDNSELRCLKAVNGKINCHNMGLNASDLAKYVYKQGDEPRFISNPAKGEPYYISGVKVGPATGGSASSPNNDKKSNMLLYILLVFIAVIFGYAVMSGKSTTQLYPTQPYPTQPYPTQPYPTQPYPQ